jgi:hypothetical protein
MNILVVASGFSKLVDAFLVYQHPFGNADFFANVVIELFCMQSKCHEISPEASVLSRAAVYQQSGVNPMPLGAAPAGSMFVWQSCGQEVVTHESPLL